MTEPTDYTIGELAARAGVTTRTIRYYVAEGLLPPPDARGPTAHYGHTHLLRLQAIARLKAAYLPLGAIRERLAALDDAALTALLASDAPTTPSSAADYAAQVLQQPAGPPAVASPAPGQGATMLLAEGRTAYQPAEAEEPPSTAGSLAMGRVELPSAHEGDALVARARASFPWQRGHAPAPQVAGSADERWRRVALAPGVELHMREPLAPGVEAIVQELIAQARRLLGKPAAHDD